MGTVDPTNSIYWALTTDSYYLLNTYALLGTIYKYIISFNIYNRALTRVVINFTWQE